jgi:hypothetical protein
MATDEEFYELDEETVPLEEGGRMQALISHAMYHPRLTFGGGSLLVSLAADIVVRFDPLVTVLGLAAAVAIGWNGDSLARGMRDLIPGANQEQAQEDAYRFAEKLAGDYPVYADQSTGAKLRRLFRMEQGEVVDAPPKPKGDRVKELPSNIGQALTYERICTWFEQCMINDKQFFTLLKRIDNDLAETDDGESGETVKEPLEAGENGESPVKFHQEGETVSPDVSPEDEIVVVRTAIALQQANGKVTREDIKVALNLNNKKHWIIKVVCDKYGIAMPPGRTNK